jgi:hypothetical protein
MAVIIHVLSGRRVELNGRVLVGRLASVASAIRRSQAFTPLRLTSQGVSTEHASIDWDGNAWILRDLHSRNGTRINGTLLARREWRLVVGDEIIFGDPSEQWRWVEGSAPVPFAVDANGQVVRASGCLLLLPDDASPVASVSVRDGRWLLDMDGEEREVHDGERVTISTFEFDLALPTLDAHGLRTQTIRAGHTIAAAKLSFSVSRDEEHVGLKVTSGDTTHTLGARSFHYLLLTLARARRADQLAGVPVNTSGWVYADDLARRLGSSIEKVNVDIYRARQLAARLNVFVDADNIVERRPGQVRIGSTDLAFETDG